MICLALDLAKCTGWAFGERGAPPHAGHWDLAGYSDPLLGRSLSGLYSAVFATVKANNVGLVGIEAALRTIHKRNKRGISTPTSAHGDRVLTMLSGVAIAAATNAGAHVLPAIGPSTWRSQVLGVAYPKDPKRAALDYCALNKWNVTQEDAAEAACILMWVQGQAMIRDRHA